MQCTLCPESGTRRAVFFVQLRNSSQELVSSEALSQYAREQGYVRVQCKTGKRACHIYCDCDYMSGVWPAQVTAAASIPQKESTRKRRS